MKKPLAVLAGATVALGSIAVPALAARTSVAVRDNEFAPGAKTIRKGDRITFRWRGDALHNVRKVSGPGPSFSSKTQRSGRYVRKFTRKGRYTLVCSIHPGMDMKVVVK